MLSMRKRRRGVQRKTMQGGQFDHCESKFDGQKSLCYVKFKWPNHHAPDRLFAPPKKVSTYVPSSEVTYI